jgi:DNA-binding Lrp family transcriptional regulator
MFPSSLQPVSTEHHDPINAAILAISEDKIAGFHEDPFSLIAEQSGQPLDVVLSRIRAMLEAGTIRRVRQTLIANNLAPGSLVAWRIPEGKLDAAFDFMFREDPFSGHVVIRSTDATIPGGAFRLWTTIKVPTGFSLQEHCELLQQKTDAESFRMMPAKGIFALGVGHVRRKTSQPGDRSDQPATMMSPSVVTLTDREWEVLMELKRELLPEEIIPFPWAQRAKKAGIPEAEFLATARSFEERKILGRFSTFLEHVKPSLTGVRVTRFNGLFHWAVPPGREAEAGAEIGRHDIMTHCYWREGGPDFYNVNMMGVAHGTDRSRLLEHKAAIDQHLQEAGIPLLYTNVFWGGKSEIKPSEISPIIYQEWWRKMHNRLLPKLADASKAQGASGAQTRSVHEGRENTSTRATQQIEAAVELGKKSND